MKKNTLVVTLILMILCGFSLPKAASQDQSINCAAPNSEGFDKSVLPDNMRFVLGYRNRKQLYLVNPHNDDVSPLGDTWGYQQAGIPIPFDDGKQLLIIRQVADNETIWQTMNIDGTSLHILRNTSQEVDEVYTLKNNQIRFSDFNPNGRSIFQVMNLDTGEIVPAELPELRDFVPLDRLDVPDIPLVYHYSANMEQIAYWAYQTDTAGQIHYDSPYIVRVQNIKTGTYVDIPPISNQSEAGFSWNNSSDKLSLYYGDIFAGEPEIYQMYSSHSGEILYQITPPENMLSSFEMWSPDEQMLATEWSGRDETDRENEDILVVYGFDPDPQPIACFQILSNTSSQHPFKPYETLQQYFWTADGHYIWWLECSELCETWGKHPKPLI